MADYLLLASLLLALVGLVGALPYLVWFALFSNR